MSIQIPNQFEGPTTIYPVEELIREEELEPSVPLSQPLGKAALEGFTQAVESDKHAYAELEISLKQAIIGQPKAIDTAINALRREFLKDDDSPIASMLFLGPTGVGKTETGKELARQLHPGEDINDYMLRIDCSDFQQGHEVGSLVGAPPGYIGHGQKPRFASKSLREPYNVVIFDEIEKANESLYKIMLQIMEEGEVNLQNGKKASFRNSIIVMTSNLGADKMMQMLEPSVSGFQPNSAQRQLPSEDKLESAAYESVKKHFAPEFINRLDSQVVFQPLDDESLGKVLDMKIQKDNQRYADKAQIKLQLMPDLHQKIIDSCDDRRQFGARPIIRKYQQMVESMLSQYAESHSIPKASQVIAALDEQGEVKLHYKRDNSLMKEVKADFVAARKPRHEVEPSAEIVPVSIG